MKIKKEALFLRVDADLNLKLKKQAESSNSSLNEYCIGLLKESSKLYLDVGIAGVSTVVKNAKRAFGDKLESVIIFGSRARGDHTVESDVDVLIVVDGSVKISRQLYKEFENNNLNSTEDISVHIAQLPNSTKHLSGLWCEVSMEGIITYDKEFKTSYFLSKLREEIIQGSYLAKQTHGHRYWTYLEQAKEAA